MNTEAHTLLGLPADATSEEVHLAWKRLCALYDPARFEGASDDVRAEAARQLADVNAAYLESVRSLRAAASADSNQMKRSGHRRGALLVTGIVAVTLAISMAGVLYSARQADNDSDQSDRRAGPRPTTTTNAPRELAATTAPPACRPNGNVTWVVDTLETALSSPQYGSISPAVFKVDAKGRVINGTSSAIAAIFFVDLYDASGKKGIAPSMVTLIDETGNARSTPSLAPGQSASWVLNTYSRIQQPDGTFGGEPAHIVPQPVASLVGPNCLLTPLQHDP